MSMHHRKKNESCNEDVDIFGTSKNRQDNKSKKQKTDNRDILEETSIFGELINKAGFILRKGDQPNLLRCDQAVFQKDLRKFMKINTKYQPDKLIDKFIEAFDKHLHDITKLKWALLYTQTTSECTNARGGQQDSLIRLLLNVDELQPKLVTLLTEKLLEIAYDEEAGSNQIDIPRLILANLRWLDHIVDPKILALKMSDLLQGSPTELQKEVINFVPNIVDDQNHPRVAKELCDLYESTPALTSFILDSLPHLTLPPDSLQDIHHSVLKTLQTVKPQNLPIVIKFLLHNTSQSLATQVLNDIREKIKLPGDSKSENGKVSQISASRQKLSEKELADYETLLFSNIKMSLLTHKFLNTSWLKTISELDDPSEVGIFDIIILIVVYEVVPNRRKIIESIIRNKIRGGLPVDVLLKPTFKNHAQVLKEYFDSLKKLSAILLRSAEPSFSNYGAALYRFSFIYLDDYNRQEIILSLLAHLGDNESVRMASLCLLSQLAHEQTDKMAKYVTFLKGALDLIDLLNLRESKKLMDAIILLAHSQADKSGFKDELNILVRKQLSHSDIKYKRLGVLSAVLTLKNTMGCDTEHQENPELHQNSLKEAEELFQMVKTSTINSPHSSSLFMDELASNILRNGLSLKLEEWISKMIIDGFQETFIFDFGPDESNQNLMLPVSVQYCMESDMEVEIPDENIALNLAQKVFDDFASNSENNDKKSDILTLAPHFRLMRMVESHLHDGDLSSIDALLVCGVQMPTPSTYDKLGSLSDQEKSAALACLFYLINWFREIVNAFATQKEAALKQKVYDRLDQIIKLHEKLATLLTLHPGYVPPPAVFDFDLSPPSINAGNSSATTSGKKGKRASEKKGKKRKKNEEPDTTLAGLSQLSQPRATIQSQHSQGGNINERQGSVDLRNYKAYFREFHLDVFNLLFRTLSLDTELELTSHLSMSQLEFLLTDLNLKLSRIFEAGTKRITVLGKSSAERDVGFSHIDMFTAAEVIGQAHRYIKPVCVHLEKISSFFKSLIEDNDGIEDAPCMYTEKTEPIMNVYTMLFTNLKIFMSWPGLHLSEHSTILTSILRQVAKKMDGSTVTQMSKEDLLQSAFRYVCHYSDVMMSIWNAVVLVQVLEAIVSLTRDADQLKPRIVEVVEKFLKKEWFTRGGNKDKGATFSKNVNLLLQALFHNVKDTTTCIQSIVSTGIQSLIEAGGKEPTSEVYPTMTKATLLVYYRCLLENLVPGTRKNLASVSGNRSNSKKLEVWNVAIKAFHILVETLKTFDSALMLALCLKNSKGFLELFLRQGMPLMDKCFLSDQQEVLTLIRNLQLSTRFLQHICTHSKIKRETRLMQYVPLVKRSLEGLVFRVKAMLAVNQCSSAFWLGDLKNKDLQGRELLTQADPQAEEEDEEEEEAAAEALEDDQSDVDLDEEESNDANSKKIDEEISEENSNAEYSASF